MTVPLTQLPLPAASAACPGCPSPLCVLPHGARTRSADCITGPGFWVPIEIRGCARPRALHRRSVLARGFVLRM